MERRADVKNLTAILFQLGKRRTTDIERTLEIDVDNSSKAVRRKLFGGAQKITGGTIYHCIDFAKVTDRRGNSILHILRIANVRSHRERLPSSLVDRLSCRLKMLHLPAHKNYASTGFRKRARDTAGYSSSATGYESNLLIQDSVGEYFLGHGH
jgi:hypothetical protein